MERWTEAIAAYKRFVLATPSLDEAQEARERVRTLRALLDRQPPAAVVVTPPPRRSRRRFIARRCSCRWWWARRGCS
jgi:hypothetical protein